MIKRKRDYSLLEGEFLSSVLSICANLFFYIIYHFSYRQANIFEYGEFISSVLSVCTNAFFTLSIESHTDRSEIIVQFGLNLNSKKYCDIVIAIMIILKGKKAERQ